MNRISELRKINRLSQAALAEFVGVTQATISKYELDQISIPDNAVEKLCIALNCSADYLLGFTDMKSPAAQNSEANSISVAAPPSMPEDLFRRIQEANSLFLKLDEAGKAQAIAYLQFLAAQQATDPDAQG